MKKWKYALSTADTAPKSSPILLHGEIEENLKRAAAFGYHAIEVHMRETKEPDYGLIEKAQKEYGTKVCMVITGRLMTEGMCSLTDDRPYAMSAAMDGMKQYIDTAAKLGAGIVIGWAKGNIPPGGCPERYQERLGRNLQILEKYGSERGVSLNLEVINRYETNWLNTAAETMDFLDTYGLKNCYVHLDTFHMGIEEADSAAAVRLCKNKLGYVHIADNTRKYPGSGSFDFETILEALAEIGYDGYLSLECLPLPDGETAARKAMGHFRQWTP